MPSMLKLLFSVVGPRTFRNFSRQCQAPREAQKRLLDYIIRTNEDTAFGRRHAFRKIRTFQDYQKRVPICSYQDLEPYIDAMLRGEPAQLTMAPPVFFATTSGTTGKPKYIPVNRDSKSAKSQLLRVWFSKLTLDHPGLFNQKALSVVSPEIESYSPAGIPCGAESGQGYRSMPRVAQSSYSCPYEVYALKDYDSKYYTLVRIAAAQSLSFIYAVNPSTVLLLAKYLAQNTESIVRDVRDGTISIRPLPENLLDALKPYLKSDPDRAAFLERAVERGDGRLLPKHIWPDLAAIACWKGGNVGLYLSQFDEYYPKGLPVRDCGYYSSEHRGSVPISDDDCSGVLAIPTNVYEYFPVREDRQPQGHELLAAHELEKGQQYYVYVTTLGGLYRYDMNDIIEVTDYFEHTPVFRFVQKGKGFVSFTGEKLYESQVMDAVTEAMSSYSNNYEFIAAVGEVQDAVPRYSFLVEFDPPPPTSKDNEIIDRIEISLRRYNIEYDEKRKSQRIEPPVLRIVAAGEFERYRKRAVAAGRKDGQFKVVRLTQDADFAREFKVVMEVKASVS
jgi:hypothetical protein